MWHLNTKAKRANFQSKDWSVGLPVLSCLKEMRARARFGRPESESRVLFGIVVLVAAGSALLPGWGGPDALPRLLQASRAYVRDYESKLTFILAEEDCVQEIRDSVPLDPSPPSRKMKSEIYFIFAPQTGAWMAIRDVISVDGQGIADRPNLVGMLGMIPATQVAATVKARNSRFNIGRIVRNFNEPTLGLQMLDPDRTPGVEFKLGSTRTDHSTALATLVFREQGPVTLIHDLALQAAPSTGEILVEAESGRVRRTQLSTRIGSVSLSLTTDYTSEPALDMWVPSILREHYEEGVYGSGADSRVPGSGHEEIWCEAKYSHFRRFEVTGGIKKESVKPQN